MPKRKCLGSACYDPAVNEFQGNLINYMTSCCISKSELSRKLGVTPTTVCHWINDRTRYPMTRIQMCAVKYVLGMEGERI